MKIYIAGSISNDPDYVQKFRRAESRLSMEGHIVFNPAKNQGETYKEYIDMGLFQLMHCEAIYLLEGYEDSKGALLEKHYAETVGMKVIKQKENKMNSLFHKNLKMLLETKGITQRELAEKAGTTETSISRYVNGDRVPKATMIVEIANALNVTVEDLMLQKI